MLDFLNRIYSTNSKNYFYPLAQTTPVLLFTVKTCPVYSAGNDSGR